MKTSSEPVGLWVEETMGWNMFAQSILFSCEEWGGLTNKQWVAAKKSASQYWAKNEGPKNYKINHNQMGKKEFSTYNEAIKWARLNPGKSFCKTSDGKGYIEK